MVELGSKKPKINTANLQWPLWVSLALFLTVGAAFVGLKVYLGSIQSEMANIDGQIKDEVKKVNVSDESLVVRINDSIGAFKTIASNHTYFSNALDFLSSLTYAKTSFSDFNANYEKKTVQVKGLTQSYSTLAKQIVALRENENVESLDVKGISFNDKGVGFDLMITVDPRVFNKK